MYSSRNKTKALTPNVREKASNLPRTLLLATYFEMHMLNKIDGETMKMWNRDISKDLENDISTSMNIWNVPDHQREMKEKEVKEDLDAYVRRMESLLNKIEADDFRQLKDTEVSFFSQIRPWLVLFLAEFLGTAILVFLGCGSCIDYISDPFIPYHVKVLGFGFAVAVAVQIFGHISGSHINPAVTICSILMGLIDWVTFLLYICAQFLGGIAGFALLKLIVPNKFMPTGFCITKIDKETGSLKGFAVELIFTFILCLFVCTLWDPRNASKGDSIPIKLAVLITVLCFVSAPLTGASFNTARSFGPVLFGSSSDWEGHWLYWVAPNLAGFLAAGIYRLLFLPPKPKIPKAVFEEDSTA